MTLRARMRQRGAALLLAMLTVALVASFAAASLWQQWRSVEVETSERARVQAAWILTGALDWARLLLREDKMGANASPADHLGEPWAVPLQEARLSSFLAADSSNTTTDIGPEVMDAFLSGQIIDLQSVMNVHNLVDLNGGERKADYAAFERLFDILGLPQGELQKLFENLRFAVASSQNALAPGETPLVPQRVADLVWLGVSPQTVAVLEPYVTMLPEPTAGVNINTASAEVIAAAGGIDISEAQRAVQIRNAQPFLTKNAIVSQLHIGGAGAPPGQGDLLTVATNYFEVRARLRLDKLVVEERSIVRRDVGATTTVRVLRRERGTGDPTAMSRIAMSQR